MSDDEPPPLPMVVGIGASAGGLAALKRLFATIPGDTGLAYAVVVHLSTEHPSNLAEILQPHAHMPVLQVAETVALEPDHVYVIPPRSNLSAIDSHLRLSPLEESRRERAPIDHFFRTLAESHGEHAIGVVLSGTGADGSLGIRAVREHGGLTLAQDPDEAEFDGMPRQALATGLIDKVLPVARMAEHIQRFTATRPSLGISETPEPAAETDDRVLQRIFAVLRRRTGQDFSRYKQSTVLRRIRRRMQLHQIERLDDYLAMLEDSPEEPRLLAEDFLITVTQFFRDPDTFAHLEQEVIPALYADKSAGDRVRIWCVGSATGEEAYSVAMLALEHAGTLTAPPELQIFATDLHERSLRQAREGVYPEAIAGDVSGERLSRFFVPEDDAYRVRREVREQVVFAVHNLLKDPPFSRMDLIVCRNLMIYLQRNAQQQVVDLFHYALAPEGLLLLGPSETIDGSGLFEPESKAHSLYRRRNVPTPEPHIPDFGEAPRRDGTPDPVHPPGDDRSRSYGMLHHRLVERYAPPSILVNGEHQLVHASEHAGRYLRVPGGEPTGNALKLVHESLRVELRAALQQAGERGEAVRSKPVTVEVDGAARSLVLHVQPSTAKDRDGLALVVFEEQDAARAPQRREAPEREEDGDGAELALTRERLQAVIEQYESGQEDMKAANEELRSTMEELETSKEELQSMNEELQTVNQENRHKVEELSQLTTDLNNLMAATEIATLFLDRELRILRATPRVGDLFNIRASDRGRPVTDLTHSLGYDALRADAESVLARLVPVEREVRSDDGRWYLTRVLPYRSSEDRIEGVVITFIEITGRKQAEAALRHSEESFRALVAASAQIVWTTDPAGAVVESAPSWRAFTGQTAGQQRGDGWLDAVHPEDRDQARAAWRRAVEGATNLETEYRLRHAGGEWRWTQVRAVPLRHDGGEVRGWIGMNADITERKLAEDRLREADRRKDEFLAMLSHELRNPLAPMRTAMDLFRQLLPDDPRLQQIREMNERQVLHLTRLVDDLLDVARIKSGRVTLKLEPLTVPRIVGEVVASTAPLIESRGHRLIVEQSDEALPVEGDSVRLGQVLSNLLNNAAKYTPEGGEIRLSTSREDDAAVIEVADNGVGMDAETLGRIFEVFSQGPRGPERGESGLGLGLTLAQRLAELHGGGIEASSPGPGRGSRFRIRLPLAPAAREVAEPQPAALEPRDADSRRRRILVVDDNRDVADTLAMSLGLSGHEVRTAYGARDALEVAAGFAPEAVLLDIGLPDMDGYELAAALRREPATGDALLVAITGYGQDDDRARSAAAGIDHHLLKPVDLASIDTLLARRESN